MAVGLGSVLMNSIGKLGADPEKLSVASITLFVGLLAVCIMLGHLLEENRWINESVITLFIVSYSKRRIQFSLVMVFSACLV